MPRKQKGAPVHENDARHYKLTSGIPIPPPRTQPNRYPLKRMKIGQSFGFPIKEEGPVRNAIQRFRATAKSITFTIRFDKNRKDRRRIWRVT
jgi:hypothetical protein